MLMLMTFSQYVDRFENRHGHFLTRTAFFVRENKRPIVVEIVQADGWTPNNSKVISKMK